MASRLLDRLKRSLFKDGLGAGPSQPGGGADAEGSDQWDAELEEEEEECVTDRLGGTLSFAAGGAESEMDSDSDWLGESTEEWLSSAETSPGGVASTSPSPSVTPSHEEMWGRGLMAGQQTDRLLFEVTDACIAQDASSRYVLYTIQVTMATGDRCPATIARRYTDFQKLHTALRRYHGDQMGRVCFPRKRLGRNFTAETIAKRSRAFEQYLSHLCSKAGLRGALCVRQFFYLTDLQTAQLLMRVGRHQEALAPLLNAQTLQDKLGVARGSAHGEPGPAHWLYTQVALWSCFQEAEQLAEAQEHCGHALRLLAPHVSMETTQDTPPATDRPRPLDKPHPLLFPLLRAMVRLSWQTGRDKRQWEGLLQQLEEQWAGLDSQPTIREFLVKHHLLEGEG